MILGDKYLCLEMVPFLGKVPTVVYIQHGLVAACIAEGQRGDTAGQLMLLKLTSGRLRAAVLLEDKGQASLVDQPVRG